MTTSRREFRVRIEGFIAILNSLNEHARAQVNAPLQPPSPANAIDRMRAHVSQRQVSDRIVSLLSPSHTSPGVISKQDQLWMQECLTLAESISHFHSIAIRGLNIRFFPGRILNDQEIFDNAGLIHDGLDGGFVMFLAQAEVQFDQHQQNLRRSDGDGVECCICLDVEVRDSTMIRLLCHASHQFHRICLVVSSSLHLCFKPFLYIFLLSDANLFDGSTLPMVLTLTAMGSAGSNIYLSNV